ncbi:Chromobox protein-like 5 [Hondaea fermentalgiana]|uniref:Chromobox protein-like 5 n=1 Tax=Hondaea fermentalgiana TaxID=2315210 RepID=A0A2R5FZS6_9STRA|nr:Chromobox protein-like 5 [Hondaea fermentalgiana]|eukprot:GBG24266.1 Chromobox protein-like 5 [Hondaea fermentalgiana]
MRHESTSDDDDNEDVHIEKILSRRKVKRKGATVQEYLVKWEDHGDEHNTWETRKDLIYDGFKTQVESYDAALKAASAPRSKLGRKRRTRSKTPQARSKKISSSVSPSSPPSSSSEQIPVKETDHASESSAGQTSQEVQSGQSMSNNLTT